MPSSVKSGGVLLPIKGLLVKGPGGFVEGQFGYLRQSGAWLEFFANEVVATLDNALNVNIQALFSGDDWASSKAKRVILPAGKKAGSNAAGTAAMRTGTGRGGKLIIDVAGGIEGAGGAANGGTGGDALLLEQAGVTVNLSGAIKAGGGGGGKAGNGGPGSYTATEGPYANNSYRWYMYTTNSAGFMPDRGLIWGGSGLVNNTLGPWSSGGYTYYSGASFKSEGFYAPNEYHYNVMTSYAVHRTYTAYSTGGTGGNGGRGQGYDGPAAAGAGGSAGGANAGAGGTGGTGGAFGLSGGAGANGAGGNNGGGAAGAAGGLAGFGIRNPGNADAINNTGTLLGR